MRLWLRPTLLQAGFMRSHTTADMLTRHSTPVWRTRPASLTLLCLHPLPGLLCVRACPGWS